MLVMVVSAGAARARPSIPDQRIVLASIDRAVAKGRIDRSSGARYRAVTNRAARLIRRLPRSRSAPISTCLAESAAMAGKLTAPRAAAVFGQLAANNNYFVRKQPPRNQTDITDADGVVYRYFSGR
jgi:hypothetical protein